jgi:hypothetical protein
MHRQPPTMVLHCDHAIDNTGVTNSTNHKGASINAQPELLLHLQGCPAQLHMQLKEPTATTTPLPLIIKLAARGKMPAPRLRVHQPDPNSGP